VTVIKRNGSKLQTVLLAGVSGYIGKYVCETLQNRGFCVLSLGRTTGKTKSDSNEHISIDLFSDAQMAEFAQSVHELGEHKLF
jgi:nucleoside-diphosphate-sugar epimerase